MTHASAVLRRMIAADAARRDQPAHINRAANLQEKITEHRLAIAEAELDIMRRTEVIKVLRYRAARLGEGEKMDKYQVAKLSDATADGYAYRVPFKTWGALTADMQARHDRQDDVFKGRGSDIFQDGVLIGSLRDFSYHEGQIRRVSLDKFLEYNGMGY